MRMEYFEEAVNYLLSYPERVNLAFQWRPSFSFDDIKAAVIINGSVAAVGNTIYYKDETIPPVSLLRNRVKMTKDGLLDVVEGLQSPLVEPKSFVPVERSDATFLLLVGQDDHNWKSEFYANEISKRLQAHGKEKPQSSATQKRGIILSPLISHCARLACTSWLGLISPLEGSLSLMLWPSWMHGSNSRLSSTNSWVVRVRG
ncbi:hypothetical protein HispidOSU_007399 [Sigmodon hispidus]